MTTTYWKGSRGGGIKVYLSNLAREFQRRGIAVDVIFKEGFDSNNYMVEHESRSIFPRKVLSAFFRLKKLRPNVIHSHGGMFYYIFVGLFYRCIYGCKLIYTFHTEPIQGLSFFQRFFLQLLLSRCDCITFVSRALEQKIDEKWGLHFENSTITYAGVKSEDISDDQQMQFRQQYGLPENSAIILSLGLTAMKYKAEGLAVLIRAIEIARKSFPNITLVATRTGAYVDYLKNIAKEEEIETQVVFAGDIDNSYIALAACQIYAHISFGEGLPIALLEAMAMGKPIIATRAGGIPEAINDGENGILVEADANKIAKEILNLLHNEDIAMTLGRNAKKTMQERFTWKTSADRFLDIYTKSA
jgi:glycosyltransferase involved in cell wall biosynthesis